MTTATTTTTITTTATATATATSTGTRAIIDAGRAKPGAEAEGDAGLRDEARRLRGENARLLSILACREQELHELKNLDSADHETF